jgi:hypothetical protein
MNSAIALMTSHNTAINHAATLKVLPPTVKWTPATHPSFPLRFRRAVWAVLLCGARTEVLVEDCLFVLLSLLPSECF